MQRMRTSTNHGKILIRIFAGLSLGLTLAIACFLFALFRQPSPPYSQHSKSATSQSQTPHSQSLIPTLRSEVQSSGPANPRTLSRAKRGREREELREEHAREEMEEMEHELEEA